MASCESAARSMDELQNTLGEGPCLTVLTEQTTVLTPDLDDEHRWPRFVRSAVGHGVRSILGIPLPAEGESRAVLNLCANRPNAFSHEDISTAQVFAEPASRALPRALKAGIEEHKFTGYAEPIRPCLRRVILASTRRDSRIGMGCPMRRVRSGRRLKTPAGNHQVTPGCSGHENVRAFS